MSESSGTVTFARRLFEQHGTVVHRYFKRLTGDPAAAQDLTQEVFLRVVRGGYRYEHRDRERAWVFRIARNVLLDLRRRERCAPAEDSQLEPTTAAPQGTRTSLREALTLIPTEDREAFLLREIGGLGYAEIAVTTSGTVPAVRSRIYRAPVLVFMGALRGTAQEPTGRWDPSSEMRPILSVRAGDVGRSSIDLHLNEPVRLVVTPTFRDADDLCVSSLQFGFDPTVLDRAPAAWLIEARLVELRQAEATLDLKWTRRVNRTDVSPGGSFTSEQRIELREGDSRILDLIRTAHRTSTGCESFGLTYELGLEGARTLSGAAIEYDLWLVQQDADGELATDRYKATAKQGQQVDYFFKPLPYTADGRRSDNGMTAILMNVSGAIRGRVRTDGNIDLTVDGSRAFSDAAATAATASHGRTVLTVKPGETVEVLTDLPIPGRLSRFGDLNGIFSKHRTAVRITAKRLW